MRDTIKSRREKQGGARQAITNMVRRGIVKAASAVTRWQAEGFENEIFDAVEIFQQVGFASRPRSAAAAQLIMLALQGSARAVVGIASRSTDGRPDMLEDETAIHNSTKAVKLTAAGEVLLGDPLLAVQPVIKGTSYLAAQDTMLTALASAFTVLAAIPALSPAAAACTAAASAISAFTSTDNIHLSAVTKTE